MYTYVHIRVCWFVCTFTHIHVYTMVNVMCVYVRVCVCVCAKRHLLLCVASHKAIAWQPTMQNAATALWYRKPTMQDREIALKTNKIPNHFMHSPCTRRCREVFQQVYCIHT